MKSNPNPKARVPASPGAAGRSPARTVSVSRNGGAGPTRPQAGAGSDFVRGVIAEMRRVTWPSREEWIAATILTIALVVGVGFFTYAVDLILGWLFNVLTGGQR